MFQKIPLKLELCFPYILASETRILKNLLSILDLGKYQFFNSINFFERFSQQPITDVFLYTLYISSVQQKDLS